MTPEDKARIEMIYGRFAGGEMVPWCNMTDKEKQELQDWLNQRIQQEKLDYEDNEARIAAFHQRLP